MAKNQPKPQRKTSPRLKDYDYSQSGFYFVTLSTRDQIPYFGTIEDHSVILNDAGLMANSLWQKLPAKFSMVTLDEFIIMPNHMHGIIQIIENDDVGTGQCACPPDNHSTRSGQAHRHVPTTTLSDIIHWYKTKTTNACIKGVNKEINLIGIT